MSSKYFIETRTKLFVGSLIRPKVTRSVHFCPTTKKFMERRYADMTSMDAFPTSSVYPTKVCLILSTR